MSLAELLPAVHALPRRDKFQLIQELLAELAQEEGLPSGEYPIWSPYDAHEAATTLMQLLEQDRKEAIEGIQRGLEASANGRVRPASEVFADLRQMINSRYAERRSEVLLAGKLCAWTSNFWTSTPIT